MTDNEFIKSYLNCYQKSLIETDVSAKIIAMKKLLVKTKENGNKVLAFGNGGSAAMVSHVSVDYTKQAGIRTVNFNEADLITCFSNDYGYDKWVEKAIEFYGDKGDTVILVSSSGSSMNMINGARKARDKGLSIITLTGFDLDNSLRKIGDLNFWVDSRAYNVIENTHQIWLLIVCDLIIGKIEYPA